MFRPGPVSRSQDILNFAKNRLHKFYNPKMYQAPAKKELTEQGRIAENMNGAALVQISAHQHREAPPPPPETWGAYQKKSDENTGVIAMIDLLIRDLDKEMTEAEADEKHSQAPRGPGCRDGAGGGAGVGGADLSDRRRRSQQTAGEGLGTGGASLGAARRDHGLRDHPHGRMGCADHTTDCAGPSGMPRRAPMPAQHVGWCGEAGQASG